METVLEVSVIQIQARAHACTRVVRSLRFEKYECTIQRFYFLNLKLFFIKIINARLIAVVNRRYIMAFDICDTAAMPIVL